MGRELRVQNPRRKGKEPACHSGVCSIAKGQRTSTGKPSKGETLTGPAKTSVKEDTVYKGGKGTAKKPPGGGKSLPQPQGSEPRRGDKPESGSSRKSVKGTQEGPQTVETGGKDDSGARRGCRETWGVGSPTSLIWTCGWESGARIWTGRIRQGELS